jgi:hypothetical protein
MLLRRWTRRYSSQRDEFHHHQTADAPGGLGRGMDHGLFAGVPERRSGLPRRVASFVF